MENERNVYYSSKANIDLDTYKDVNKIIFKRNNCILEVGLILLAALFGYLFYINVLTLSICIFLFIFSAICCCVGVVLNKNAVKHHIQQKVKYQKDIIQQNIEFSDRIYVSSDVDIERSYEYALVEKLYETEESFLLIFTGGVVLTVDKSGFSGSTGADFRRFIFDKCYSVKKPVFKKLRNSEKTYKRLVIAAFFLSVVVLMLYFFRITPENWRELGRNPKYSSSQQNTSGNTSDSSTIIDITTDSSK